MIHIYVTSRLDNGNCLLNGISDHLLTRLQRVQNAAARLITKTKKHDHITAVLIDLCWLTLLQVIVLYERVYFATTLAPSSK